MAKLTQFGRMRRRIKRELEAARFERASAIAQAAAIMAAGHAQVQLVMQAAVLSKTVQGMVAATSQGRLDREEERLP